ncbi:hypothetical protein TWF730_007253 [Orbilia blumenaviensis]|uniref:Uncharacterized protein n=1 Tax=Orbilia blumenaviensis TaxID=1796055 RepID=A0AAV9V9S8_9PEZI
MVKSSKIFRLGAGSLLLFLKTPYVSAVIINVVVSEVDEVWQENTEDALRLCRPPPEEPWLGVYAIDPKVTSCEKYNGGSSNWDIRESEWERPEYLPKPPGTVLQIEGPGPSGKKKPYAISNTQDKEDYLSFGDSLGMSVSEPSKWLIERFGNNNNYETLAPDNLLQVGDTLRFWDPEVPNGFQQLYMHRIKGSPQRFNRLRPLKVDDDESEVYADELTKVRQEYPAAEFRIASLGNSEIVGPGVPTSRTWRLLGKIGGAPSKLGKMLTGLDFRSQPRTGQIDLNEKIPIRNQETRVRSEELDIEPGDVFGNPDIQGSPEEVIRSQRIDLPQIPSQAEIALRKSLKKESPVKEAVIAQFEESKEQESGDGDPRKPVDLGRSSRSSQSGGSKLNESGRGRSLTPINMRGSTIGTVYQTAFDGADFDYDEENRLDDIIDYVSNDNNVNQPVINAQAGTGIVNQPLVNEQGNANPEVIIQSPLNNQQNADVIQPSGDQGSNI